MGEGPRAGRAGGEAPPEAAAAAAFLGGKRWRLACPARFGLGPRPPPDPGSLAATPRRGGVLLGPRIGAPGPGEVWVWAPHAVGLGGRGGGRDRYRRVGRRGPGGRASRGVRGLGAATVVTCRQRPGLLGPGRAERSRAGEGPEQERGGGRRSLGGNVRRGAGATGLLRVQSRGVQRLARLRRPRLSAPRRGPARRWGPPGPSADADPREATDEVGPAAAAAPPHDAQPRRPGPGPAAVPRRPAWGRRRARRRRRGPARPAGQRVVIGPVA